MKKTKKLLTLSAVSAAAATVPFIATACSSGIASLCDKLKHMEHPNGELINVEYAELPNKNYNLFVHNKDLVGKYLTANHTKKDMASITTTLKDYVTFPVKKYDWGSFIPAANISDQGATSYTSIWLRDTVWNIMALQAQGRTDEAKACTLSIMKYMSTKKQVDRMKAAIKTPKIVLQNKDGAMNAVHIRFNAATADLDDVYIDGKPEDWHHKQNDALGLYISLFIDFALANPTSVTDKDFQTLVYLVGYLNALEFYKMEDSGAWEEIEKVALSSVGCVVSAFQKLREAYGSNATFKDAYDGALRTAQGIISTIKASITTGTETGDVNVAIKNAIENLIIPSIEGGGESVLYAPSDKEYRKADTAMLDLIYPMNITDEYGFNIESKIKILAIVEDNNNDFGIIRYKNDTYQSSDYWFRDVGSTNTEEDFIKREKAFVAGSEASWFFDSWMAICYGKVIEESKGKNALSPTTTTWLTNKLHYHINKALAFINKTGTYRGNGTQVAEDEISIPESYVVVIDPSDSTNWYHLASPVDPLRWAQSALILMTSELGKILS